MEFSLTSRARKMLRPPTSYQAKTTDYNCRSLGYVQLPKAYQQPPGRTPVFKKSSYSTTSVALMREPTTEFLLIEYFFAYFLWIYITISTFMSVRPSVRHVLSHQTSNSYSHIKKFH